MTVVKIEASEKKDAKEEDLSAHISIKRLGLLTVVLVIVAVALVLIPRPANPVKGCLGIVLQQNKISCLYDLAISSHNASVCSYITQPNVEASCYAKVGTETLNPEYCSDISKINSSTYSYCMSYIAKHTDNASMCAAVQNDSCVTSVGMQTENISTCNLISNQSGKSICLSSVGIEKALAYENSSYCLDVSSLINSTELQAIALNINMSTLLGSASNTMLINELSLAPSLQSSPRDICYIALAAKTGNASYCSGINSSESRGICESSILPPRTENLTYNYTELISLCKNTSYSSICSKISGISLTIAEAIQYDNVTKCSTLNSTASWVCYAAMAKAFDNESYCSYISNSTYNSACIFDISSNSST
ncbi:MAG: hypothetical protein ACP5MK_00130 [Candidatus Micrarchaeia archaeon]